MQKRCGPERFERALTTLPPRDREEYEHVSSLGWVRQDVARAATRAVAMELGVDPVALAGEVVEESVAHALRGVWAVLLRNTSDEALVSRAATIFEKSFDRGTFRASQLGPGRAQIVLEGWPSPHEMDVASIARSIAAALAVAGRAHRRVTTVRDGERVRFEVDAR